MKTRKSVGETVPRGVPSLMKRTWTVELDAVLAIHLECADPGSEAAW